MLSSFPNHLRNLQEEHEDLENPFLLEPINSTLKRHESELPSLMLFEGASDTKEEVMKEEDPQTMMTWEEEEMILPTMSPMEWAYRTTSPSPRPETSNLWDPSHESSMETKPKQTHSSLSTLGT